MPQISEISSSMVPGTESPETSLQVSSTSPEICDEPSRSKALSVRKIGKPASRSSSSSSRASLPPSGVQRGSSTGDACHRGLGSFPQSVSMNRMDVKWMFKWKVTILIKDQNMSNRLIMITALNSS